MGRSPWIWNLEALGDPGVSPHFVWLGLHITGLPPLPGGLQLLLPSLPPPSGLRALLSQGGGGQSKVVFLKNCHC